MKLEETLRCLLDVPCVTGAFIVSECGQVLCKHVPGLDDAALSLAGVRICRLCAALDPRDSSVEWAVLRFEERQVCVYRMGTALLCVIATAGANPSVVRTAMNGVWVRAEPGVRVALARVQNGGREELVAFDPKEVELSAEGKSSAARTQSRR